MRAGDEAAGWYDDRYYATRLGEPCHRDSRAWHSHFDRAAAAIVAEIAPRTVLDAGCGIGLLVEKLRERGVEAWGIDISPDAVAQTAAEVAPYVSVGSVLEPFDRDYDLIVSIEVLEHLPADRAFEAVANMAACTDQVLFSSTPTDFREPTHLNVRPTSYWVEQFGRLGFFRDVPFDAGFVSPQAIFFRRAGQTAVTVARDYEEWHWRTATELRELREANLALVQRQHEAERLLALQERPDRSRRVGVVRRLARRLRR